MQIVHHVNQKFLSLGLVSAVDGNEVVIQQGSRTTKVRFDQDCEDAFQTYTSTRTLAFDLEKRTLHRNTAYEIQLTFLSQNFGLNSESYHLEDSAGNSVQIAAASTSFQLAFFDSSEYQTWFDARWRSRVLTSSIPSRRFTQLLPAPVTAVYTHKGRKVPTDLDQIAAETIKRCLFRIAVEYGDCFVLYKAKKRFFPQASKSIVVPGTIDIPRPKYDDRVVNYYKVAKSNPFSSQNFLSYYHVIEYYFLKVSELKLHDRLAGLINSPSFHTSSDKLDKVISAVRGQDARLDETEMLRSVLDRYVSESELIDFLVEVETQFGDKRYTKRRTVFGEDIQISPQKDHALANTAKVVKHIRNAIVHSSDRYNREEVHVPLTNSEDVIEDFVPLVRFLAEKVIYGNAE